MKIDKPFSTGQVAKYCRVSAVTVFNWIKANKIKYYTTAGGQYRIEKKDLMGFLTKYGIPVHDDLKGGDRYKVLVVDDDEDIIEFVKMVLGNDPNIELFTANDGYEGCLKVGLIKPDLVLLDIVMPRIDGVQVCKKILENEETNKAEILVFTGYKDKERIDALKKLGINKVLSKPLVADALKKMVYKKLKI